MGKPYEFPGSWRWPGPGPAIVDVYVVNQQLQDLAFVLALTPGNKWNKPFKNWLPSFKLAAPFKFLPNFGDLPERL